MAKIACDANKGSTIKNAFSRYRKLLDKEDKSKMNKLYKPKKKLGFIQLTDIKK